MIYKFTSMFIMTIKKIKNYCRYHNNLYKFNVKNYKYNKWLLLIECSKNVVKSNKILETQSTFLLPF